MLCMLQFAIICTTLVQHSFGAPWDINNDVKEFDIEWQCQQFCNRINGNLEFNPKNSSCVCIVDTKNNIDFNAKYLENKLNDIGFNFKIIDRTKPNSISKREIPEKLRKILAERIQREIPPTENQIQNPEPVPEIPKPEIPQPEIAQFEKLTLAEKLQRIREKLQVAKENKIITAPEESIVGQANPDAGKEVIVEPAKELPNVEPPKEESPKVEPPKEEPPKTENDKLNDIRAKIAAIRSKNSPLVIRSESFVGNPPIEVPNPEPPKELHVPPVPHDRLDEIRAKLAAIRNKNLTPEEPEQKVEPVVGNALPQTKPLAERIKEIRERLRMRLQNRKLGLPNEDGHIAGSRK